jgi:hypothetical protein
MCSRLAAAQVRTRELDVAPWSGASIGAGEPAREGHRYGDARGGRHQLWKASAAIWVK